MQFYTITAIRTVIVLYVEFSSENLYHNIQISQCLTYRINFLSFSLSVKSSPSDGGNEGGGDGGKLKLH